MSDEHLRPVSSDKLIRCEACGEMFLKTDIDGQHIRYFGMCRSCYDYFDGFYKSVEAIENCFNDQRSCDGKILER